MVIMTLSAIDRLIAPRADKEGRPYVAGTGISVARFGALVAEGLTPQQMYDEVFDGALSLAQIHAALACYYENRAAIDAWTEEQDAEHDRQAALHDPA
jgi:uncharacterized protein (DUF433 family)